MLCYQWMHIHGVPEIILSDRGKEFLGVVTSVCQCLDIKQVRTTPYHPRTNGLCESQHSQDTDHRIKNPFSERFGRRPNGPLCSRKFRSPATSHPLVPPTTYLHSIWSLVALLVCLRKTFVFPSRATLFRYPDTSNAPSSTAKIARSYRDCNSAPSRRTESIRSSCGKSMMMPGRVPSSPNKLSPKVTTLERQATSFVCASHNRNFPS